MIKHISDLRRLHSEHITHFAPTIVNFQRLTGSIHHLIQRVNKIRAVAHVAINS